MGVAALPGPPPAVVMVVIGQDKGCNRGGERGGERVR